MNGTANKGITINFGLSTILGIVFLVLKLTHVITWSWWIVLAPFWGPYALAIVLIVITLIARKAAGI